MACFFCWPQYLHFQDLLAGFFWLGGFFWSWGFFPCADLRLSRTKFSSSLSFFSSFYIDFNCWFVTWLDLHMSTALSRDRALSRSNLAFAFLSWIPMTNLSCIYLVSFLPLELLLPAEEIVTLPGPKLKFLKLCRRSFPITERNVANRTCWFFWSKPVATS